MTFESEYEPFFQPPGWIVAPIWIVLYTTLAFSFKIIVQKRDEFSNFSILVAIFFIQLAINLTWPSIFNSEKYLISLIMIICMVCLSLVYVFIVHPVSKEASKLVWPYIAWVSFAGIINTAYYLEFR
ncbi:MAG: TspO/MBR family protein [Candidatus Poseidoniaceae archaeon]